MAALGTAGGGPLGITALGGTSVCPGAMTPGPPDGANCWALGWSERVGCWAEAATGDSTTNATAAAIRRSRAPFPTTLPMARLVDRNQGNFKPTKWQNLSGGRAPWEAHAVRMPHGTHRPGALKLLRPRRSIKPVELAGPGLTPEEIDTLLTIASRVPDHGKLVPWRFIVFDGDARHVAGEAIGKVFCRKFPDANPEQVEYER